MLKTPKKIIGIDPGSVSLGIALIENRNIIIKDSCQIELGNSLNFYERLSILRVALKQYFDRQKNPTEIEYFGIEMPWVGFNANVAIKLGQVRGVIIAIVQELFPWAKIIDITPMEMRTFLNINRKCKKEEMHKELKKFYPELENINNLDQLDSIAVALATQNKIMIKSINVRSNLK